MSVLQEISKSGGHVSWGRHEALISAVHAGSASDLAKAHKRILNELKEKNIWMAVNDQGVLLSRQWPNPPGIALVCFPDQGTALQVLDETGANNSFNAGVLSYENAIKSSNENGALLVMVTYDGSSPQYVPVSHLSNEDYAVSKKVWWRFW